MIREIVFPKESPTTIYEDKDSDIDIVNSSIPTEITRHIDARFFAIQGWKEAGNISMQHIYEIINPTDDLTKPLSWVLNYRHDRYPMGN